MPIKILLVDDDEAFRSVTAIALESEGCIVREACDGYAALEALNCEKPDVIISDLDMPGLNGLELSSYVRSNPALSQVHFILLSGLVDPDGSGIPSEHQADLCFSKQIHIHHLYQKIASLSQS